MLVGRTTELQYLKQYYEKSGSQIIVLYGQKYVGKKTLLREFAKDKPSYYYQAEAIVEREQQFRWGRELIKEGIGISNYPSYEEILKGIVLKPTAKKVIVLDEFQHMVKNSDDFMSELVDFVHQQPQHQEVLVVLCSSSIGWIENSMVSKIGELVYDLSGLLKVKELKVDSVKEFFACYDTKQCIEVYSVLGGFPGLWKCFDEKLSVRENICKNILKKDSFLKYVAMNTVKEELREISVYNTILASLAQGKNKLNELHEHTLFSRAKISVYLKNLMELEIVEKVFSYDTEGRDNTQKGIYRICNHLVCFYFTYLYPNTGALETKSPEDFYEEYIKPNFISYTAGFFGKVCGEYLTEKNEEEKLPVYAEEMGEWVGKTGTIDLIAQGGGKTLIAGGIWDKNLFTYEDYEWLLFCANKACVKPDFVYLFARDGFDEKLVHASDEDDSLHLICARDL